MVCSLFAEIWIARSNSCVMTMSHVHYGLMPSALISLMWMSGVTKFLRWAVFIRKPTMLLFGSEKQPMIAIKGWIFSTRSSCWVLIVNQVKKGIRKVIERRELKGVLGMEEGAVREGVQGGKVSKNE